MNLYLLLVLLSKGTTIGTETDLDGNFLLSVDSGDYVLVFDFLGYKTLEVPVSVNSGETVIVNNRYWRGCRRSSP